MARLARLSLVAAAASAYAPLTDDFWRDLKASVYDGKTGDLPRFEAFCVCVNLLMGVGFLSLPSAFVDAGLALSVLLLAVGSALLILTALWEAETILRATAVKQWRASAAALRFATSCAGAKTAGGSM